MIKQWVSWFSNGDENHGGSFLGFSRNLGIDHVHPKTKTFSEIMYCTDCHRWFRKVESTDPLVSYWEPCSSLWARLFYRNIYKETIKRIKEMK